MSLFKAAENRRKKLSTFNYKADRQDAKSRCQNTKEEILFWKKRMHELEIVAGGLDRLALSPYVRDVKSRLKYLEAELEYAAESDDKELSEEDIYNIILDTPEGILAGKMAFFKKVKKSGSFRNNKQAFEKADEIHKKIKGKRLYRDFSSFESSQSQFFNKDGAQKLLKEILKPFK